MIAVLIRVLHNKKVLINLVRFSQRFQQVPTSIHSFPPLQI